MYKVNLKDVSKNIEYLIYFKKNIAENSKINIEKVINEAFKTLKN